MGVGGAIIKQSFSYTKVKFITILVSKNWNVITVDTTSPLLANIEEQIQ